MVSPFPLTRLSLSSHHPQALANLRRCRPAGKVEQAFARWQEGGKISMFNSVAPPIHSQAHAVSHADSYLSSCRGSGRESTRWRFSLQQRRGDLMNVTLQ